MQSERMGAFDSLSVSNGGGEAGGSHPAVISRGPISGLRPGRSLPR